VNPEEERLLSEVRSLIRADCLPALEAALAWGLPKCRTLEERMLYPALLLVLGNLNALVTTRRLEPGDLADFHLTLSRAREGAPPLRAHLVLRVAADEPPTAPAVDELWLSADAARAQPLACAAKALELLLTPVPEGA
jgi:hypothetical protein